MPPNIEKQLSFCKSKKYPDFEWSLRPIFLCTKFVLGLNLNITSRVSVPFRLCFPIFGLLIIISSLAVNGPCGFYSYKRVDSEKYYRNYGTSLENQPLIWDEKLKLIQDLMRLPLFVSTLLIHLIFMSNVILTKKWRNLFILLEKIQMKMKLDVKFHEKCRRYCLIGLLYIVLVN